MDLSLRRPPSSWGLKVCSHYSSDDGGEGKRQLAARRKQSQPAVGIYHHAWVCRQTGRLGLHLLRYTGAWWQRAISRWRLAKGHRLERGVTGRLLFESWHRSEHAAQLKLLCATTLPNRFHYSDGTFPTADVFSAHISSSAGSKYFFIQSCFMFRLLSCTQTEGKAN